MMLIIIAILFASLGTTVCAPDSYEEGSKSRAPGKYGYYEVRDGAHLFWWLLPARNSESSLNKDYPLVLWLQGGPGASGAGYGNFEEIGPYSVGWKPRKHSWAEKANLLFVDNPVGTGFSYVTSNDSFARNDSTIAADLTMLLRRFLDDHDAHNHPLYIFSESYGGKMCAVFAERLLQEQASGRMKVNLRGIALGDSWISPLDYVLTWPDFLKAWSLLDDYQLGLLAPLLLDTQDAVFSGNLTGATDLWAEVELTIRNLTDKVDWYNALLHNVGDDLGNSLSSSEWLRTRQKALRAGPGKMAGVRLLARQHEDPLTKFMRGDVTKRLGIIPDDVVWGSQAGLVFEKLSGDFMVDVIGAVDAVLEAGLPVTIYNGQLDLICSTLGLDAWLPQLRWPGLAALQAATPQPLYAFGSRAEGRTSAFVRAHANLAVYIVLNAGHMIPRDQPVAMLDVLGRILEAPSAAVQ